MAFLIHSLYLLMKTELADLSDNEKCPVSENARIGDVFLLALIKTKPLFWP